MPIWPCTTATSRTTLLRIAFVCRPYVASSVGLRVVFELVLLGTVDMGLAVEQFAIRLLTFVELGPRARAKAVGSVLDDFTAGACYSLWTKSRWS